MILLVFNMRLEWEKSKLKLFLVGQFNGVAIHRLPCCDCTFPLWSHWRLFAPHRIANVWRWISQSPLLFEQFKWKLRIFAQIKWGKKKRYMNTIVGSSYAINGWQQFKFFNFQPLRFGVVTRLAWSYSHTPYCMVFVAVLLGHPCT